VFLDAWELLWTVNGELGNKCIDRTKLKWLRKAIEGSGESEGSGIVKDIEWCENNNMDYVATLVYLKAGSMKRLAKSTEVILDIDTFKSKSSTPGEKARAGEESTPERSCATKEDPNKACELCIASYGFGFIHKGTAHEKNDEDVYKRKHDNFARRQSLKPKAAQNAAKATTAASEGVKQTDPMIEALRGVFSEFMPKMTEKSRSASEKSNRSGKKKPRSRPAEDSDSGYSS